MQPHQTHDYEIDSDTDEGFIPCKNIVHHDEKKQTVIKKQEKIKEKKKQFVPRYILEGIMSARKEPAECYQRFMKFDFIECQNKNNRLFTEDEGGLMEDKNIRLNTEENKDQKTKLKLKEKEKLLTPCDKYVQSGDYSLVYARYRDFKFSNDEPNFANHNVRLDCLKAGQGTKFKTIRAFEIIEQKLEQPISRSSSLREAVLQFDSKFECGNLLCAFKHKKQPYNYTLLIQNDSNTYGYNHWFYFSVKNAQIGIKYRFNIVNFRKRHSFFKEGNKPVVFSLADSRKQSKSGYSKRGEDVKYGKSSLVKSYESKQRFFQLSFTLQFWNESDIYYISTGLPYSYSNLLNNLSIYEEIAKSNKIKWNVQSVGTSISGNKIPYVTITKFQDYSDSMMSFIKTSNSYRESVEISRNDDNESENAKYRFKHNYSQHETNTKRVIFLTARQHPGQTWSSYLMDEFIHSLVTQSTLEARYILDNFIVKCIPMINVDGVISGNFRCDLTGMDLNRNWKTPSAMLHPQIFSIKNQIQSLLQKGYQIEAYIDLHGHSKQYNLFCYSCKTDNYECRLLPYLLSQYHDEFYFPYCTFGVSRYKMTTARAVVFQMTRNPNVLTIQSSFFGSKIDGKVTMFDPQSMKKMSISIIKALKSYFSHDDRYHKCKQIIRDRIVEFMQYKGENGNNVFSGSDSQPSGDQIQITERLEKMLPKGLMETSPQIQQMKKATKNPKKKVKKQVLITNSEKVSDKKEHSFTKNQTLEFTKYENLVQQTTSNNKPMRVKNNQSDLYNNTTTFKNKSFMMSNKSIDEEEITVGYSKSFIKDVINRKEHKLPFFARQRHGMVPLSVKNQSSQIFKDAYNATERNIKPRYEISLDDALNQRRHIPKKLTVYKQSNQKDNQKDDLPILCILSQNKRKRQMEVSLPQKRQSESLSSKNKVKTAIHARTEAIKNLREKSRNSSDMFSKVWRDNIQRYGNAFSSFRIHDNK